jgi:hypothetical protein
LLFLFFFYHFFQGWPSKYDDSWKHALDERDVEGSFDSESGIWGSILGTTEMRSFDVSRDYLEGTEQSEEWPLLRPDPVVARSHEHHN